MLTFESSSMLESSVRNVEEVPVSRHPEPPVFRGFITALVETFIVRQQILYLKLFAKHQQEVSIESLSTLSEYRII